MMKKFLQFLQILFSVYWHYKISTKSLGKRACWLSAKVKPMWVKPIPLVMKFHVRNGLTLNPTAIFSPMLVISTSGAYSQPDRKIPVVSVYTVDTLLFKLLYTAQTKACLPRLFGKVRTLLERAGV